MLSTSSIPTPGVRSRASLACLPCRTRHIKCDATRPACQRCSSAGKPCSYAKSRRGGLDRSALAAVRRRNQAVAPDGRESASPNDETAQSSSTGSDWDVSIEALTSSASYSADDLLQATGPFDLDNLWFSRSASASSLSTPSLPICIYTDMFLESYYQNFHMHHPCVLPRRHLKRLSEELETRASFNSLLNVMRYIGSLYLHSEQSPALKREAGDGLCAAAPLDPFMVQAHLLYSIAIFWQGGRVVYEQYMDTAVHIACELGMFRREFAAEHGRGEATLQESWRRTWWQLYCVDAYYKGTTRVSAFRTKDFDATVDLPCEDVSYESGIIPEPKTLQDFDCREFCPEDNNFSSFAYLIGAVRCAARALIVFVDESTNTSSPEVIESLDSSLEAWLLLLPPERKVVINKLGEIDELMFQAHALVHTAIIHLHRQYSDLKFNPVEGLSSCAADTPSHQIPTELVNIHTTRMLKSIHAQIRLLALPVRPFNHTPFISCMTTVGTLSLLSACKYLFRDRELIVARDQIRMTIGCLKEMGAVWPETARTITEMQLIARDVLGLGPRVPPTTAPTAPELSPEGVEPGFMANGDSGSENALAASWMQMPPMSQDFFCAWMRE